MSYYEKKKKSTQPFFLQVFPPISLYWPFSSLRSTVTVQCVLRDTNNNHSITVGLLPLQPPDTLQLLSPLFLPFSNPQRGLLSPLISQVTHTNRNFTSATAARGGSAGPGLSRHSQHYTSALAEDPSPRKPILSPQKSCCSRHFVLIPTRLSAHVPWVWRYSYCNGLLHPQTEHLETGRERSGCQKAPS